MKQSSGETRREDANACLVCLLFGNGSQWSRAQNSSSSRQQSRDP